MSISRAFLCGLALATLAVHPALAQVDVESLEAAKPFAPGVQIEGLPTLDPNAWQGTTSERAIRLLNKAPVNSQHPLVRQILRRVVLSGIVPPEGNNRAFDAARLRVAQSVATPSEYDSFAQRNAAIAADPRLRADAALSQGNLSTACEISDQLTVGRGETYWVRLRAACHEERGETAAAELAREILRDRDEPIELEIGEAPQGFWAEVSERLDNPSDLSNFMNSQARGNDLDTPIPGAVDLLASGNQGVAQAFFLAERGSAEAMVFAALEAEKAGIDPHRLIAANRGYLSAGDMVQADLVLFAEHAVIQRDLGLLQALYSGATDDVREPLALAADALGGGYEGQPLGQGLDSGLDAQDERAIRDTVLALGLGATLSETAEQTLTDIDPGDASDLLPLKIASEKGAQAEVLLRAASHLDAGLGMAGYYDLLQALRRSGFNDLAGQIAAYEMLQML